MLLLLEDTDSNSIHSLWVTTKCLALEWSLSYIAFFEFLFDEKTRDYESYGLRWATMALWNYYWLFRRKNEYTYEGHFSVNFSLIKQNKKQQNLLFEVYDFPRPLGQCSGKWRTPLPATSATLGQLSIISVDLFGSCIMLSHLWWALGASRLPEG